MVKQAFVCLLLVGCATSSYAPKIAPEWSDVYSTYFTSMQSEIVFSMTSDEGGLLKIKLNPYEWPAEDRAVYDLDSPFRPAESTRITAEVNGVTIVGGDEIITPPGLVRLEDGMIVVDRLVVHQFGRKRPELPEVELWVMEYDDLRLGKGLSAAHISEHGPE